MSNPERDRYWMLRALAEAARARGFVEPNPLVGAVLIREDRLVAVGYHEVFGGPHAEVVALRRAGEAARGATLYVTLEPCCHQGKTPACVDAVIEAGVARVVVAVRDPYPKVDGGGISRLKEVGIAVEVGLEAEASCRLNSPYLKRIMTGKPYVTAKWAMTLDGKIATANGQSAWISGPRSRALVHEVRGRMDAIVVGIGAALSDDPRLTVRPQGARIPSRVVLDSSARLPLSSVLARTAREIPVCVVVTENAPGHRVQKLRECGCEVLEFIAKDGRIPIEPLLDELGRRGMTNILVEGGAKVLGAFLEARQIEEVDVFIAPMIEGGSGSPSPIAGSGFATMAEAIRLVQGEITVVDGDIRFKGLLPGSYQYVTSSDSP